MWGLELRNLWSKHRTGQAIPGLGGEPKAAVGLGRESKVVERRELRRRGSPERDGRGRGKERERGGGEAKRGKRGMGRGGYRMSKLNFFSGHSGQLCSKISCALKNRLLHFVVEFNSMTKCRSRILIFQLIFEQNRPE